MRDKLADIFCSQNGSSDSLRGIQSLKVINIVALFQFSWDPHVTTKGQSVDIKVQCENEPDINQPVFR